MHGILVLVFILNGGGGGMLLSESHAVISGSVLGMSFRGCLWSMNNINEK